MELLADPYIVVVTRWLLAGVLMIAGIGKLLDVEGTTRAILSFWLLPRRIVRISAMGLPWLEIAVGIGLLIGVWTSAAAALSVALFAFFTIVVVVNLIRGRNLDCHCFGRLYQSRVSPFTVFRNACFTVLSAQVLFYKNSYFTVDGWLHPTATVAPAETPVDHLLLIVITVIAVPIIGLICSAIWRLYRLDRS